MFPERDGVNWDEFASGRKEENVTIVYVNIYININLTHVETHNMKFLRQLHHVR